MMIFRVSESIWNLQNLFTRNWKNTTQSRENCSSQYFVNSENVWMNNSDCSIIRSLHNVTDSPKMNVDPKKLRQSTQVPIKRTKFPRNPKVSENQIAHDYSWRNDSWREKSTLVLSKMFEFNPTPSVLHRSPNLLFTSFLCRFTLLFRSIDGFRGGIGGFGQNRRISRFLAPLSGSILNIPVI